MIFNFIKFNTVNNVIRYNDPRRADPPGVKEKLRCPSPALWPGPLFPDRLLLWRMDLGPSGRQGEGESR